ncbi:MAG TPA: MFS transporter [Stellaceae bacterium]|nr:MFS transporter [Stellaceae bacterium]
MDKASYLELLPLASRHDRADGALVRSFVIGLTAFLTVVDLFATQAILPMLAGVYHVTPAAMGVAVNASTLGMAVAGLAMAFLSRRIDRRRGILLSLALLSIPTALLAVAPNLAVFTVLRIAQGLFMATAFTLTLAYLSEHCSAANTASAFASYITGNVASNLFGRLLSAAVADHLGLAVNFYVFALLNLLGAVLVHFSLNQTTPMPAEGAPAPASALATWRAHLRNRPLRATFGIGFCILFAFIGTFTYVNFVLVRAPFAIGMMTLGLVYFVFLPSIVTTLAAGVAVRRFGTRPTFWGALAVASIGLPLLITPSLAAVLIGLALVGVGTFFAQATATGFVGRAATADRGAASGIYLACYFFGGLVGAAVLGQVFDRFGWTACVTGVALSLAAAALLAVRLKLPAMEMAR